jgi:DNA-binding NarL/FixJ family response regulator
MRVVLVGPPAYRSGLRAGLPASVQIVGEVRTIAEARQAAFDTDAWLVVPERVLPDQDRITTATEPLTPRELEVLTLLAEGLANKVIAARLGISDQTVKFHVAAICGKLSAANRTDAVRRAIHLGLIPL